MPQKIRAPLKGEVKAVVDLLNQEFDDENELAKAIITAIYQQWAQRDHIVVVTIDGRLVSTWGVYRTIKEAQKAIGDPIIASRPGTKGILTRLHYDISDHGDVEEPPL